MLFAVLGAGNTGKAYSAYLKKLGHDVLLYDRSVERLTPIAEESLKASGTVEGEFSLSVTNHIEDVHRCDVILVCTVAAGHRHVASLLKGHLRHGQTIIVTNSCWGAVEFDLELGEEARSKDCVISEMSGQLILCSSPAPNTVYLKSIKKHMTWSCISSAASCSAFNAVHAIFPQLKRVSSVLETTMNNTNPVAHIPLSLFNLTRMDNGEDYLLFRTCVTRGVARVIEEVDNERIAVMQACGIPAVTELDTLNSYWTSKQDCIFDIFHETPEYAITVGPKTLEHRYITEDLPFGVVPVAKLGKILGVQTSCMDAMIKIFSVYLGEDLLILGPAVEDINLARYIENA